MENPQKNILIQLTTDEAEALLQMLDAATKAIGLRAAGAAAALAAKVQEAAQALEPQEEKQVEEVA